MAAAALGRPRPRCAPRRRRAQPGSRSRSAPRRFRVLLPTKASPRLRAPRHRFRRNSPPPLRCFNRGGPAPRCRPATPRQPSPGGSKCGPRPGGGPLLPCHPGARSPPPRNPAPPAASRRRDGAAAAAPPAGHCFPAGPYCQRTAGGRWLTRRRRRAEASAGSAPPASPGRRGGAEGRRAPAPPLALPRGAPLPRQPAGRRGPERGGSHARRRRRGGSGPAAVAAMGGPGGLSRARRLCHWGPLVALAVVAVCSATAMADAALWYWPLDTTGGSVNFIMLLNWTVMILYNYFSAMFVGPGYVPLGWTPVSAAFRSPRPRAGLGGAGAGSAGRGDRRARPAAGRPLRGEGAQGWGRQGRLRVLGCRRFPFLPGEGSQLPPTPPAAPPLVLPPPLSASRPPRCFQRCRPAPAAHPSRSAAHSQPGPAVTRPRRRRSPPCTAASQSKTSTVGREWELQGYRHPRADIVALKALFLVIRILTYINKGTTFSKLDFFFLCEPENHIFMLCSMQYYKPRQKLAFPFLR